MQLTDSCFGGGETCGTKLSRVRTFCWESSGDPLSLPVPVENLFKISLQCHSVNGFSFETDALSLSDYNPNEIAFQFQYPCLAEELQVSIDKRNGSHWNIFTAMTLSPSESTPEQGLHQVHSGKPLLKDWSRSRHPWHYPAYAAQPRPRQMRCR